MSDIRKKRDILHQLVQARNAVKRKYNLLKFGKENFDKTMEETFKPIVDPLQELVTESKKKKKKKLVTHRSTEISPLNTSQEEIEFSNEESNDEMDDTIVQNSDFETAASASEDETADYKYDKYVEMIDHNNKNSIDKIYGVRKRGKSYVLGNSTISFVEDAVVVDGMEYPKTEGLMELLVTKRPNKKIITSKDTANYRKILEITNAHKRGYRSDELLRTHNSTKFNDIIAPMFMKSEKKKGGALPRYKIARQGTKMDYVYWDDPNELVDRLRLLMAERSAGNPSHTNEIQSIIEELREGGYIY